MCARDVPLPPSTLSEPPHAGSVGGDRGGDGLQDGVAVPMENASAAMGAEADRREVEATIANDCGRDRASRLRAQRALDHEEKVFLDFQDPARPPALAARQNRWIALSDGVVHLAEDLNRVVHRTPNSPRSVIARTHASASIR